MVQAITENEATNEAIQKLSETLSKLNGIRVFLISEGIVRGRLFIYFTYKERQSSVEQKVKFIDWLARILGNSEDYAAYLTSITMNWIGDKGVNGENEPFFCMDTLIGEVESLTEVLITALNIRETIPSALRTNHCGKDKASIAERASIFFNRIRTVAVMSRIAALANPLRFTKSHVLHFLTKPCSFHSKNKLNKGKAVCQSQQNRTGTNIRLRGSGVFLLLPGQPQLS